MISGIGGFSVYPPLQGGYLPSQQGVGTPESQEQGRNQQENAQIIGTESGRQESTQVSQTQQSESNPNQEKQNAQEDKEQKNLPEEEKAPSGEELSEEEKKQVQELKTRDAEVRAHEQAHLAAAGSLAQGGASFDYQSGPDGNRYAVGGEVSIDTSKVPNDPAATIVKAQRIRRAALAPAEPSSTDRSVAAGAASMEAQARKELAQENQENLKVETEGNGETANSSPATDFYKKIQNGSSSASQGVSKLDMFV